MEILIYAVLGILTLAAIGIGGYMFLFRSGFRRASAPKRDMRTTWKVVKLGGPLPEGVGLNGVDYGVIISTNDMLEQAQTLLFCPMFDGLDEATQKPLAILPWHVQVEIRQEPGKNLAEVNLVRKYVSTKIVLPIGHNEIDTDGLERGYLDDHSRAAVARKLSLWMPPFARVSHL